MFDFFLDMAVSSQVCGFWDPQEQSSREHKDLGLVSGDTEFRDPWLLPVDVTQLIWIRTLT